jgi:hypothetical protein
MTTFRFPLAAQAPPQVAQVVGDHAQTYLYAIERGLKEPGAPILFRIGMLYGKSIEWLLTGSDGGGIR